MITKPARNAALGERSVASEEGEAPPAWSDSYYHELVERSDDMILTMDPGGIVTVANRGAERVLGFSPEELVGTNIMNYLAPGELERAHALFARSATSTDALKEELVHIAKDGHLVFLDISARTIWVDGQVVGLEGIGRDVTDRHALQEALAYQALHASYGIHSHTRATYEMDHLIPLELGGSNRRLCMTRLVLIATREDDKEPMRGAV